MQFYNQIRRIERLDLLLRRRATGTPEELAERLGISVSQVYQVIRLMKDELKAPIYYSRVDRSYCYRNNVKFVCDFIEVEE
ncbi:MAG TPA: HTH domain-containing protein [Bacteroidales bacterium]|nr:HTH domain-containing protein [Bacteroidales bacterium]HRW83959.1 HTH domain-containing protein [Bacteroidales bacterium]